MHDLRASVYAHLQRLSLAFFTRTRTGEVQSRIANDIGGVQSVVTSTATSIVSNVTTVIATSFAMLFLNWQLSLVAFALLPVFVLLTRRVGRAAARDHARQAGVAGRHLDARRGVALGLGRAARQDDGAERRADRALPRRVGAPGGARSCASAWRAAGSCRRSRRRSPSCRRSSTASPATPSTSGWAHGLRRHARRLHHAADAALLPGRQPAQRAGRRAGLARALRPHLRVPRPPGRHRGARGRRSTLDARACAARCASSTSRSPTSPSARCSTTSASSPQPGSKVAIVGETGSGKTTLGYLIARLYDVTGGAVLLDGTTCATSASPRCAASSASSRRTRTSSTARVRENLRFARPDATDEQLEEAARAARIHDHLASLPDGYDTIVGERGYRFSGGEKQRLAIARAILRDPRGARARRGHERARRRDRAPRAAGARRPGRRPHDDRHRPPPLDDPRLRPDPRARPRAHRSSAARTRSCCALDGRYARLVERDAAIAV